MYFIRLIVICLVLLTILISFSAFAVEKCQRDDDGSVCCWDPNIDGPWKPITC